MTRAVEFIKKSDLLKFEDILPLFSDFVHIDVFKEELSHCLNEYKDKLDELTEDMNEATLSAEHIRSEIKSFKNRYVLNCIYLTLKLFFFYKYYSLNVNVDILYFRHLNNARYATPLS